MAGADNHHWRSILNPGARDAGPPSSGMTHFLEPEGCAEHVTAIADPTDGGPSDYSFEGIAM